MERKHAEHEDSIKSLEVNKFIVNLHVIVNVNMLHCEECKVQRFTKRFHFSDIFYIKSFLHFGTGYVNVVYNPDQIFRVSPQIHATR